MNTPGDAVKIWRIGFGAADYPVADAADYVGGQLYKNISKDEDDHEVVEFKDKEGQVILKKVQLTATAGSGGHTGWLSTYYVYDDLGNLRFVIPPKAVEYLEANSWSLADADIRKELCFRYLYDGRKRMIVKQVPGAEPVEMVYDVRDRLVFSQDGKLRADSKWLTTFYDELNRPVMTALYTTTQTRDQLQTAMNGAVTSQTITHEIKVPGNLVVNSHDGRPLYQAGQSIEFTNGFDSNTGEFDTELNVSSTLTTETIYATNPLPSLDQNQLFPLTYTYYDTYGYPGKKTEQAGLLSGIPYSGTAHTDAQPISSQTHGLVTGTKVRLLEGNGANDRWLTTTTYYDAKGRVRQVLADNATGGEDIVSNLYNFTGQLLTSSAIYRNPSAAQTPEIKLLTMMEYDHGGRLLTVSKKVGDNGAIVKIATNQYDALGQLKTKTFKSSAGADIETLTYDYNIRGWLKAINKAYVDGGTGNYFGQELSYDYGFSTNRFNGNIAGIKWRGSKAPDVKYAYGYDYDAANRLLKGDFTVSNAWEQNYNPSAQVNYDVKMGDDGLTQTNAYDANGNILRMRQWGETAPNTSSKIDDLAYVNQLNGKFSNKLQSVTESGSNPNPSLGDFKELTPGQGIDYTYDLNGNMITDANKGISQITYNHLNLPELITITGKGTIRYVYDAAGIKHRKTVTDNTGGQTQITTTAYNGGLVYERDSLRLISHEEGRIRLNYPTNQPVTYTYDYFVKDHLGNIRMVLTEGSQQQLYLASMETERSATENALFSNIESSRSVKPAGYPQDATAGSENKQVAKLNGQHPDKRVGPSLVLRVMAGDTISIGAKAFYKSIGTKQDKSLVPVADMAASLIRAFGSGQPGSSQKEVATEGAGRTPFNDQFINDGYQRMKEKEPADPAQANRPKAYLNFALFDDRFNLVEDNSGVKQVKAEPDQLQTLAQDRMVMKSSGYLYVYTSNETPQDVFFDNLTVLNSPGPVLEETHYYPFGLTMAGISAKAVGQLENKQQKFQGQPFDDELELQWYGFKYRNHDPQIGRFIQIDPLSDKYVYNSTYAFSENKVTAHVELEGLESVSIQGIVNQIWNSLGISKSYSGKEFAQDLGEAAKRPEPYIGAVEMVGQATVLSLVAVMTEGVGSGSLFTTGVRNMRNTASPFKAGRSPLIAEGQVSRAAGAEAGVATGAEAGIGEASAASNGIQLTKKTFGHTFTTHGEDMTNFLINRAKGSGMAQGQFLDNQKAAQFILDNVSETANGALNLPMPNGFPARVIMPDGTFKAATHIRLVPSGGGVKTAYPLIP
ncbi:RHS repeat protein [Chitinophaga lutea]|uniref:RHS repeat protein n=1 Tax=Chitinophaga lutea TaxID=2488634 RepID=UPI0013156784|nr:RHS repeat-associated core domain-containing protein [Chitinophaga lutea]